MWWHWFSSSWHPTLIHCQFWEGHFTTLCFRMKSSTTDKNVSDISNPIIMTLIKIHLLNGGMLYMWYCCWHLFSHWWVCFIKKRLGLLNKLPDWNQDSSSHIIMPVFSQGWSMVKLPANINKHGNWSTTHSGLMPIFQMPVFRVWSRVTCVFSRCATPLSVFF